MYIEAGEAGMVGGVHTKIGVERISRPEI